ncbi:MAG: hypothetical protein D6704_06365 [Nitrospirae bacterium]|nr:MAG: hypothetical protein D6704_06365 [Nitrospirota bacterium]
MTIRKTRNPTPNLSSGDFIHEICCSCGCLLAKTTPSGIQIKCRRCKIIRAVPWKIRKEET